MSRHLCIELYVKHIVELGGFGHRGLVSGVVGLGPARAVLVPVGLFRLQVCVGHLRFEIAWCGFGDEGWTLHRRDSPAMTASGLALMPLLCRFSASFVIGTTDTQPKREDDDPEIAHFFFFLLFCMGR
ncbi:hypothetical protein GOBAR_DD09926 [Gossypium barbadense]|nr:hypothetical protein GOBAR_DD09926 [Gossypium barbadense]